MSRLVRLLSRGLGVTIARVRRLGWSRVLTTTAAGLVVAGACRESGPPPQGTLVFAMVSGAVEESQHIWRINASGDDSTLVQITSGSVVDAGPRLSPDGRFVAFHRTPTTSRDRGHRVVVRELATGREAVVPSSDGGDRAGVVDSGPFWAPDGSMLGFQRTVDAEGGGAVLGSGRLWVVPVVRGVDEWVLGHAHQVSPDAGISRMDGDWVRPGEIFFSMERSHTEPLRWSIGVVRFPGGEERELLPADCCERQLPRVAPDGERLVHLASRQPQLRDVVLTRLDGSGHTIVACEGQWGPFAWSPDGRYLVMQPLDRPPSLWLVEVPSIGGSCQTPVQLVRLPRPAAGPYWGR